MSIFRGAIVDSNGLVDVGNLALFWVMVVVLGVISYDCVMTTIDYFRCGACRFDPLPLAQATGLVTGAFSVAMGALGAYGRLMPPGKNSAPGDQ